MQQPDYKIYVTLLDAFDWYIRSENENAEQEFLDKVNRVPIVSDAADKGKAFNDCLDFYLNSDESARELFEQRMTYYDFNTSHLSELKEYLRGAIRQYHTSRLLQTSRGLVELYGYIDYIKFDKAIDLKTTANYELGKYSNSWQKIAYPYCLADTGLFVNEFEFLVTDFKNIYSEPYPVDLLCCEGELIQHCEQLIGFLEAKRLFITDKKIFNQEPSVLIAEHEPELLATIVK